MSLGARITKNGTADDGKCGRRNRDPLHRAICRSVAEGVPYVVAAGNADRNVADYVPASYDEVITVSALADYNGLPGGGAPSTCYQWGADDTFARFSNFGPDVDVGAPGVCIKSTWKAVKKGKRKVPGYKTISGTSMASPHVAGAAAVYAASNPGASPAQVREFVTNPLNTEANGADHVDTSSDGQHPEPVLQMDNY